MVRSGCCKRPCCSRFSLFLFPCLQWVKLRLRRQNRRSTTVTTQRRTRRMNSANRSWSALCPANWSSTRNRFPRTWQKAWRMMNGSVWSNLLPSEVWRHWRVSRENKLLSKNPFQERARMAQCTSISVSYRMTERVQGTTSTSQWTSRICDKPKQTEPVQSWLTDILASYHRSALQTQSSTWTFLVARFGPHPYLHFTKFLRSN